MTEHESIPTVLACDVGNTAIHFAAVRGDEVTDVQAFRLGDLGGLGAALAALWDQMPEPRKIAAASVNTAGLNALEAAVHDALHEEVAVVGRDLPLPLPTKLHQPESCGTDRLCAAVAAYDRLGKACVVADFGTAVTIDCVDDEGVFLGGAILPGLAMAARSLDTDTAQLPEVKLRKPEWTFGRNTEEAILTGLVQGTRGALRMLVEAYATELGIWPLVIVTGGDATLICEDPSTGELVQALVPDLTIRGVAIAYYKLLADQP